MEFGIASVAGITVICYLAAQAVKATNLDNKWLPVICGVLGGILGVVGLYWIPEYPAQDIIYGNCCRYYVWFSSNWCQSGL